MKKWTLIKNWLGGGCVYFTLLSLLLILFRLLTNGTDNAGVIYTTSFLLLFPAGLCISLGGMLMRVEKLPRWCRYLFHYLLTVLAVFLFLYLPSGVTVKPISMMLMLALLSVLYWVLFGLTMLIVSRVRKLMEED